MPEPTPAERALLGVYQRAEAALMKTATAQARHLLNGPDGSEAQRRDAAIDTVRAAAQAVARRLDVVTPGLYTDVLTDAAHQGEAEAAKMIRAATGGNAYTDRGIARGVIDRLAVALITNTAQAHRAILRTTPDAFRAAVADAVVPALVGTETGRAAAQRAWWDLSRRGIAGFRDRSGRNWRLSSYAEMATRTATARARQDAKHDRLSAEGLDLVIVGGDSDRCTRCRPWHGRILSVSGRSRGTIRVEHPIRDGEYVEVPVAGSVAEARAAGWGHPQCRCSTDAYLPGITRVPSRTERIDTGEQYKARQRQRALERQIRAAKEAKTAALDQGARTRANAALRSAQTRMDEHMRANPDLLRRRYRESPGAGHVPSPVRQAELAAEAANPLPRAPGATPVRKLRDSEVEDRMNGALAREDYDAFDVYAAEVDRRDAAKTARREQAEARRVAVEEERGRRFEELLAQGYDEEDAVADAYGIPVERQRRDAARARLEGDGYRGSFNKASADAYKDDVVRRYGDAEDATNGYMLTREAAAKGIDPLTLFTGPEARARRYASPELLEWWDAHGRPTLSEYRAELLDPTEARRMRDERGDWLT